MKIDLHLHTEASFDCVVQLPELLDRLTARGIAVQAVTDHNEIWGAQKLRVLADERRQTHPDTPQIIVGEEVSTSEGEIIGLFLSEQIPRDLSPEETVARIRAQGGLVLLPHGFDPLKKKRLKPEALARIAGDVDLVESFNARISRPRWNHAGAAWADARGLPKSAGSDAHTLADVGDAWVETPECDVSTPERLLAAVRAGEVSGNWTHPLQAFAYKMWDSGFAITRRYVSGRRQQVLQQTFEALAAYGDPDFVLLDQSAPIFKVYVYRMNHETAVSFIAAGVGTGDKMGGTWADLGAGSGVFARALSELLGPAGVVIAVDRDARALTRIGASPTALPHTVGEIRCYHADFRRPLELPPLDGLLLANSLHFVSRQEAVLRQVVSYVRPQGRVLVVEYDEQQASPWNPHPVPPERFKKLAAAVGLQGTEKLGRRPSRFGGRELYTAVAFRS